MLFKFFFPSWSIWVDIIERNVSKFEAISGFQPHLNLYKGKGSLFISSNKYLSQMDRIGLSMEKEEMGDSVCGLQSLSLKNYVILIPVMRPKDK